MMESTSTTPRSVQLDSPRARGALAELYAAKHAQHLHVPEGERQLQMATHVLLEQTPTLAAIIAAPETADARLLAMHKLARSLAVVASGKNPTAPAALVSHFEPTRVLNHVVDACLAPDASNATVETALSILANAAHFGCVDLLATSGAPRLYAALLNADLDPVEAKAEAREVHAAQALAALSNLTATPEGCQAFSEEDRQLLVEKLDVMIASLPAAGPSALEAFSRNLSIGVQHMISGSNPSSRNLTSEPGGRSLTPEPPTKARTKEHDLVEIRARTVLRSLRQAAEFKFAVGDRVRHVKRGLGTVTELMHDGRTRVAFDPSDGDGQEHRYKPGPGLDKLRLEENWLADADDGVWRRGKLAPHEAALQRRRAARVRAEKEGLARRRSNLALGREDGVPLGAVPEGRRRDVAVTKLQTRWRLRQEGRARVAAERAAMEERLNRLSDEEFGVASATAATIQRHFRARQWRLRIKQVRGEQQAVRQRNAERRGYVEVTYDAQAEADELRAQLDAVQARAAAEVKAAEEAAFAAQREAAAAKAKTSEVTSNMSEEEARHQARLAKLKSQGTVQQLRAAADLAKKGGEGARLQEALAATQAELQRVSDEGEELADELARVRAQLKATEEEAAEAAEEAAAALEAAEEERKELEAAVAAMRLRLQNAEGETATAAKAAAAETAASAAQQAMKAATAQRAAAGGDKGEATATHGAHKKRSKKKKGRAINLGSGWTVKDWLASLKLGVVMADALLAHVRAAQPADADPAMVAMLEQEFMETLGGMGSVETIYALLQEALVLERLSETLCRAGQSLADQSQQRTAHLAQEEEAVAHEMRRRASMAGGVALMAGPGGGGKGPATLEGTLTRQATQAFATLGRASSMRRDGIGMAEEVETVDHLHAKFQEAGAFHLSFGRTPSFFAGLSGLVGLPAADLGQGMHDEHTDAADSDDALHAPNYDTTTSARVEWWFVVEPSAARLAKLGLAAWPDDKAAVHKRAPHSPRDFHQSGAWAGVDRRLDETGESPLSLVEFHAARLYTVPKGCAERMHRSCRLVWQHRHTQTHRTHQSRVPGQCAIRAWCALTPMPSECNPLLPTHRGPCS